MPLNECDYQSYLLRIWLVKSEDAYSWRASLEDVKTGELLGFASLDELVAFLENTPVYKAHLETGDEA